MSKKAKPNFTVTGPDTSDDIVLPYADLGPALSRSLTEATRQRGHEVSFYVRDRAGDIVGRSETDAAGVIRTWRLK